MTTGRKLEEGWVVGGCYQVDRFIGGGGMREVYLCRDLRNGEKRVAVKTLGTSKSTAETASLREGFSSMSRLRHPNLVHVMDLGILDGTMEPFIVEEYVEGSDLLCGTEGWGSEGILGLVVELVSTIHYLHNRGIVHGNLKPSNVMLSAGEDRHARLRLLDYGLERWSCSGQQGGSVGKVAYTAPEILLGSPATRQSDLYSLGILTYQLLARRLPFEDDDPGFLIQKQLQGTVDLRPIERMKVGGGLPQLIRSLLEKNPDRRPASAEEVIHLVGVAVGRDYSRFDVKGMGTYFSAGRFVGRKKEMSYLQGRAARVRQSGRGWTVFLLGEAGSGKTRCMEELRIWALLEGWHVVEGSCVGRDTNSYEPYRQIFAETERTAGDGVFRFDELPRLAESKTSFESSEFAAGQFRDLLTRELVRRLAEKPTLLLLHDFQWSDDATGTVLDYLTSDIQVHPILMCVSVRSGEEGHGVLNRVMEQSVRQQRAEMLPLNALTEESVAELISSMTGEGLGKLLGAWIYKNIGGNPFFVEEILKYLVDQGLLRREHGGWRFELDRLVKWVVPESVAVVLQRRLEQLSEPARELSNWLALIRRPVRKDLLGKIAMLDGSEVATVLDELISRQITNTNEKPAEDTVELRHALISEVIHAQLPARRRQKMHRRIAEALEQEYGPEAHLQELAMHCMAGKLGERAVRYVSAAGRQAREEFAHENAFRFLDYVLHVRDGLSNRDLSTAAIEASNTLLALGMPRRALRVLKRELLANKTVGLDLKTRMLMHLGKSYHYLGDFRMQEFYCRKALRLLGSRSCCDSDLMRAMLWAELAFGALLQSRPRQGLRFLDRAEAVLPNADPNPLAGRIKSLAASLHRVACNLHAALPASQKAAAILKLTGDSYLISSAYSTHGTVLMGLGRFSLALKKHEQAVALSEKSRSVVLRSQALGNLAECLCRMGYIDQAVITAERGLRTVVESNNPAISYAFNTILAEVRLAAADYKGALLTVNQVIAEDRHNLSLYSRGHAHYVAADLNFTLGNFNNALEHVDRLCRIESHDAPFYEHELAESLRARILQERGSIEKATDILSRMDRIVTEKHWPYQMCIVKLRLGEIFMLQQRLMLAERYVRNSLRLSKAMRCFILESLGHLLMGRIYAAHGHLGGAGFDSTEGLSSSSVGSDRSLLEFEAAYKVINYSPFSEVAWRAQSEMAFRYRSLGRMDLCLLHAREAYSRLCEVEGRVPVELLPSFCNSLGRGHAKSELLKVIENTVDLYENSLSVEKMHDEHVRIMLDVSTTVNTIWELHSLLEVILDQLVQAVGVERALVFLKDRSTGRLQLAKGRNSRKESVEMIETVSSKVLDEVAREQRPFVSANAGEDSRLSGKGSVDSCKPGAVLCAPLRAAGKALGVLYADHSVPVGGLSESTINLFAAFCNLSAIAIDNSLAHQRLMKENAELEKYLHQAREGYSEIVGASDAIKALHKRIALVAASPLDVLITGESGTGKELVARAIHRTGRRASGRFFPVDCGSLSDSLAEAELFGYRKGAFTGATENRQGLLEAAQKGVVFLDEISNLPFRLQAKLLRVLQEREIRRLGETVQRKIDVQVIAATNKDLADEIKKGRFRRDLYYRLKMIEIRVPPLRERLEDVPLLIEWFSEKTAGLEDGRRKKFASEALEMLNGYSYPGNVRELKNIVASSYYSAAGLAINIADMPPEVRDEAAEESTSHREAADHLYSKIIEGRGDFDSLVKRPFLRRQFGVSVVRGVIQRALKNTRGIYRDAFVLLRIPEKRYSVTMQFLKRNRCYSDFRPFRRKRLAHDFRG